MPVDKTISTLQWPDWLVIAAYVFTVLAVGWYFSRRSTSSDDYLLGGRQMKWYNLGISLFATMLSAVTYLALPGEMILYGPIFVLGKVAAYPLVAIIVGWWIIPRIMELEVTSAYEILEMRLGLSVRMLGSIFFLSLRLMWMALVVYATASIVLVPLLGVEESATPFLCVVLGAITIAYTSLGGLRAVVATDVLQSVILFGGALLSLGVITYHFGGIGAWWPEQWPTQWPDPSWGYDPDPKARTFSGALIATLVWYVCTQGSDQMVLQRFLANRDVKTARRTLFTALVASAVTCGLLSIVGLAVWSYFQANATSVAASESLLERADQLFPQFVMTALPTGLRGLVIAGLLAVAMSSLSSGVNSSCSVIKVDFIDRLRLSRRGSARHEINQMRWISIAVGAIVVLLSSGVGIVKGNLLAVAFKVCNLLTAPLFGLFFMAIFVRGATVTGTHLGTACGLAVIVAVNFSEEITGHPGINFLWAMPLGLVVQITVGIVVSRCFPKTSSPQSNE
ncbi:sodium:solute symporter family transporter [Adhaeretor mobilis]|uniref:Sodium/glucose cotransporter n=1 Tax=Adhaeretor mobilis TaxID=1930276 RepID=A0A517MW85_9BACT|nr:sodium/solute symporter [Adhaeretor mobilis]QDS99129.1 Sodium/glucose cotransporter [Adhaeretor mobilis]